jgi:hypothetical protein
MLDILLETQALQHATNKGTRRTLHVPRGAGGRIQEHGAAGGLVRKAHRAEPLHIP